MSETPFLRLFPGDYLAKTQHLTTIQHGAYLLLIMAAWGRKDGGLPNDDQFLARTIGLTTKKWVAMKPTVMEFWEERGGYFFNAKITKEKTKIEKSREIKAAAGRKGAEARWLKTNDSVNGKATNLPMAKSCDRNGKPYPYPESESKNPPISPPKGTRAKQIGDWRPSEEDVERAEQFWLGKGRSDISSAEQIESFIDHHTAHGKRMKDWPAAWRTWYRNAVQFTRPSGSSDGWDEIAERVMKQ